MDSTSAKRMIATMRDKDSGRWHDPRCIATDTFRAGVVRKLSRDPQVAEDGSIVLAEIYLEDDLPQIESFSGIYEVDEQGIWYYDGDGRIDDPVWRQRLIPWRYIKTIVMHQSS